MKRCIVIYNPNSGKKKTLKNIDFSKYTGMFNSYDYEVEFIETKYRFHAKEILESLSNDIDLVISIGGDGTFNEVVTGNLNRKERIVLSHIPYGTTNDIGSMFGMGKSIDRNIKNILTGKIRNVDMCSINGNPFVYVAGFGRFLNIAYETPRKLKKKFGYVAYICEAVKDFFKYATHLYDLSYEINGEKYNGLYSLCIITNANRIAGINNFYKNVKLDDKTFEILFCNLKTKKDIMRSLLYLKKGDITKVPGFYFHKSDHLKIMFNEKLRRPWCIDGEMLDDKSNTYEIKIIPDVKMLLPLNVSKELFINED